jgi:hypothetical protein
MKQIEPIQIWKNGQLLTASVLDATIIHDNLETTCTFYWTIKENEGQTLADGNVIMTDKYYSEWDGSNDYAYGYIAQQINVTIL